MILKRPSEIDIMEESAQITRAALDLVGEAVAVGVTTSELNKIAEDAIIERGGKPAWLGYGGFPATLCTSINEVVVHGIPENRALQDGDVISIDIGSFYKGYASDMARTYLVGNVPSDVRRMVETTEQSLIRGIAAAQAGARLGDVSAAIQGVVEQAGYWVVREFVGHGIGREIHEGPEVPNYGRAGSGPILRPGLVLAIEPMVTLTRTRVEVADDGWTAFTADGSYAAHVEHTVAITDDGPRVLTDSPDLAATKAVQAISGGVHGA